MLSISGSLSGLDALLPVPKSCLIPSEQIFYTHTHTHTHTHIYFTYLFNFWLCWVFIAARRLSLVAVSGGYSLVALRGLLIVVASLIAQHRF